MDELASRSGLKPSLITKIRNLFMHHREIEQALLYGSRAMGNYRNGSDIDLTLTGDRLTQSHLVQIEQELDDLMLPYKIDISLLHTIENPDLIEHIHRVGVVFWRKRGR